MAHIPVNWWDGVPFREGTIVSAAAETINLQLFEQKIPNLVLVTASSHDWIQMWRDNRIPVFCLEESTGEVLLNTNLLLQHPDVTTFLETLPKPIHILHFKPSSSLEKFCKTRGYHLLNSPASIARPLENKLKFSDIVNEAGIPGIPGQIFKLTLEQSMSEAQNVLEFPLICQFSRGFSGTKTYLVSDRDHWRSLQEIFSGKFCRITPFYPGNTWTGNGCVLESGEILLSHPFLQITHFHPGIDELPPTVGSVGNLWLAPPAKTLAEFNEIMESLGRVLHARGYRGIFGADLLLKSEDETWHTIEVNPRLIASLPALTPFEIISTQIPLLAFHMDQFMGRLLKEQSPGKPLPHIGQIIFRQPLKKTFNFYGVIKSGFYTIEDDSLSWHSPGWSPGGLGDNMCLIWQTSNQSGTSEWVRIIFRSKTHIKSDNLYEIWQTRFAGLIRRSENHLK